MTDKIIAKKKVLSAYILFVKHIPQIHTEVCSHASQKLSFLFVFLHYRLTKSRHTYCAISFEPHVTCTCNWLPGGAGQ